MKVKFLVPVLPSAELMSSIETFGAGSSSTSKFRYAIRWTAAGNAVTYRDWPQGLWRQPKEGGPPQQVTGLPDEKIYSNSWSRDGKMFAFTRGVEMRNVIFD